MATDWTTLTLCVDKKSKHAHLGVSVVAEDGSSWHCNGDTLFPAASTAKVAIMVAIFRMIDRGDITLDTTFQLRHEHKSNGSGVLRHMTSGLQLPLYDLLYLMISISDNTATNLLIDTAGMPAINATMRDLGASWSVLSRYMVGRLAIVGEQENTTTANDQARIMHSIVQGNAASPRSCEAMMTLLRLQQNRHRIGRYVPTEPGFNWGSKTGTNPGITHDVGFVTNGSGTMVAAVYVRGVSEEVVGEQIIADIALAAMQSTLQVV